MPRNRDGGLRKLGKNIKGAPGKLASKLRKSVRPKTEVRVDHMKKEIGIYEDFEKLRRYLGMMVVRFASKSKEYRPPEDNKLKIDRVIAKLKFVNKIEVKGDDGEKGKVEMPKNTLLKVLGDSKAIDDFVAPLKKEIDDDKKNAKEKRTVKAETVKKLKKEKTDLEKGSEKQKKKVKEYDRLQEKLKKEVSGGLNSSRTDLKGLTDGLEKQKKKTDKLSQNFYNDVLPKIAATAGAVGGALAGGLAGHGKNSKGGCSGGAMDSTSREKPRQRPARREKHNL